MTNSAVVVSVSSILLVAAVIGTVTYGVYNHDTEHAAAGTTSPDSVSTSSKASHAICQSTDYKDTCEKSLANVTEDSDPAHMIQVVFKAAIHGVKDVMNKSILLQKAAKDPKTAGAFEICQEVLDSSIKDIERSVDKIETFDKSKLNEYFNDVQTWLSGAITYQQTCLDAFQNKTGDTGEKMKKLMETTSELSSNGLAMVNQLYKIYSSLQSLGFSTRRLLDEDDKDIDEYNNSNTRRLLDADTNSDPDTDLVTRTLIDAEPSTLTPNVTVALDGSGQFKSIQEAINSAPKYLNQTFVILVKAGHYHEYVEVPYGTFNIYLLGEGPKKTKIIGNKNIVDGVETFNTATVVINGDNFIAKDIGFENSAGALKYQAVALRVTADKSIFYNCQIDGYQDTLYAHTHRQFYRNCTISGTIDFIFGDAAAVFQNCKLVVRKPLDWQECIVTAQGRGDINGKGAFVLQNCTFSVDKEFSHTKPMPKVFLGRPWREYSRTIIMQSYISRIIAPEGWALWNGDFALDTLSYSEYRNRGPGSNTDKRVKWAGIKELTAEEAEAFTLDQFIEAAEWVKPSGVPYEPAMMQI